MNALHKPHASDQFVKQLLFWMMVVLCLVVALAAGMMIVNWSLNTHI
jgi:hypothetical protein